MPDPDLVFRAQLAAGALEEAWRRWRTAHGLAADPMPAVSSYVGYSIEEPWGQPRVVFGLAAQDAEQLTALLERHECVGPVYAAVAISSVAREPQAMAVARSAPLPVPRQGLATAEGRPMTPANGDYAEPVFRQAAAAIQEAAAARGGQAGDTMAAGEGTAAVEDPALGSTPMGELARAATAARAEAEARIKAARTDDGDETAPDATVAAAIDVAGDAGHSPNGDSAPPASVQVHATDVLEPLPSPESAAGASGVPEDEPDAGAEQADEPETSADERPDSPANSATKRSRGSRGYSMPKISRTKRPGSVPGV
jgi:hypothetical protein